MKLEVLKAQLKSNPLQQVLVESSGRECWVMEVSVGVWRPRFSIQGLRSALGTVGFRSSAL